MKAAVPPPLKGAKPPYGDLLRKLRLSPRNVSFFQLPYARHRSFSPKPPSEPSQNPKARGNWEGIGDFCLQKCQRGRQLSPLSEATSLDSAATPRAVFLNLFWDSRFKITAKRASLVLRVEFGDRRIGKANRRKGQRPFSYSLPKRASASFCLGLSPQKGGLTVAPFGTSASRNRQSPPNFPTISGSGYVQTVALGLGRDGVRTEEWRKLTF